MAKLPSYIWTETEARRLAAREGRLGPSYREVRNQGGGQGRTLRSAAAERVAQK